MDELKTINEIVSEGIKDSSYYSVLISSGVFIIYTLINKLVDLFKDKNKNKPLIEMGNAIKEVSINVVKLNSILDKTINENEKKEITKSKNIIKLAFNNFKSMIANECIQTIVHNNIEINKELIIENISKYVSTEYYNMFATLSNYEIDNTIIALKLKDEWIKETTDAIIGIMYNGQSGVNRISQLNNKLLLLSNSYSTYIENKIFN